MPANTRDWKQALNRFLGRVRLGQSRKQNKAVDISSNCRKTDSKINAHTEPSPSNPHAHYEVDFFPAFAHLADRPGQIPRKRKLAFLHRTRDDDADKTAPLASRGMYASRASLDEQQKVSEEDEADENRPLAYFMPKGYKIVSTPSREHIRLVPKSPGSPLNGCYGAPAEQQRRSPIQETPDVKASIAEKDNPWGLSD